MKPELKREIDKFLSIIKKNQPTIQDNGFKGKVIVWKGDEYEIPPKKMISNSQSRLR